MSLFNYWNSWTLLLALETDGQKAAIISYTICRTAVLANGAVWEPLAGMSAWPYGLINVNKHHVKYALSQDTMNMELRFSL